MVTGGCELLDELDPQNSDVRDRITGKWVVDEDSEIFKKKSAERFYNVTITKDLFDSTAFYIDGFYELDGRVKVIMNSLNLDIPDQTISDYIIQDGSGSIAADFKSITLYYYVDLGIGERDVVRADYSRP